MIVADSSSRYATRVVAALAVVAALYLGHDVLVPVSLALVLVALLSPVVAWLMRRRVPAPVGATVSVLAALAILIAASAALELPLRDLATELPRSIAAARARLTRLEQPLARLGVHLQPTPPLAPPQSAADSARTSAMPHDSTSRPNGLPSSPSSSSTSARLVSMVGRTFGVTAELLSELVEVLLLALFVLAAQRAWGEKLGRAVPDAARRHRVVAATLEMRSAIARYVLVTALINVAQGVIVALAMWAIGIPSPPLWGVLTFVLEFVPYLGGFVMVVLLAVAGLAGGGSVWHALLAPLAYLAITSTQNNLVSPIAYGRGLRLNPTAILLAVMCWYTLWGVAGAFLAVPILAALRVVTDYVPALAPLGVFLAD